MEYLCLIVQILLLLCTVFLQTGRSAYLYNSQKIFKNYLIAEIIIQSLWFIANIIIMFAVKKIMVYIMFLDIFSTVIVEMSFAIYAKSKYFRELKELITKEHLEELAPNEIRKFLLKKFGRVDSIKDIEKCL